MRCSGARLVRCRALSPYSGYCPTTHSVEDKLVAELSGKSSRAYIVSHKFELPNWKPWLYEFLLLAHAT